MKPVALSATVLLTLVALLGRTVTAANLTDFVNLLMGTGNAGWGVAEIPPGPQVPFGAMRLSPDTSIGLEPLRIVWNVNGGYNYVNKYVDCFSHTHVDGAGEPDLQNFGVMMTRRLDGTIITTANYRSAFTHDNEIVAPGYYAVNLDTWNTYAEVTACGTHAGRHRYTCRSNYPAGAEDCHLLFDLCHVAALSNFKDDLEHFAKGCKSADILSVVVLPSGAVAIRAKMFNAGNFVRYTARGGFDVYMYLEVSASTGGLNASWWEDKHVHRGMPSNGTRTTSTSLGVALTAAAPAAGMEVVFEVVAGLSFVSIDSAVNNARATLATNTSSPSGGWMSFDECRASAVQQWEEVLQRVAIGNLTELAVTRREDLIVFYTSMYHAHMSPTTYTEANGEYMGMDGKVHHLGAGDGRHVSDLSLWDTYRTHGPLMALVTPEMARDTTNSMMRMYNQTGSFPVWVMANIETDCMVGHHGTITAGDNLRKGIKGVDVASTANAIFTAILEQSQQNLLPWGYSGNAAATLDYALDAGGAYDLAKLLHRDDVAAQLWNFSQAYRTLWNSTVQMFCARDSSKNGDFECGWPYGMYGLPGEWGSEHFVEGNAEQYRYYVPHNLFELVSLYQSKDYYAQQLYQFFADSTLWPFNTTLPNPFFWAGNEPTFLTPLQFNWAGNEYAWQTQWWFAYVLDQYFFNGPAGIPGNDDYGAMSSWAMFGYLGIYPAASTQNFTVFVPRFDDVTISVSKAGAAATPFNVGPDGGVVLRLVALGRPASGTAYLANASVNGRPLATPFFTHRELVATAAADGSAQIDFFLTDEATVFGAPSPSMGGPVPWQPTTLQGTTKAARKNEMKVMFDGLASAMDREVTNNKRGKGATTAQRWTSGRFGHSSHRRRH